MSESDVGAAASQLRGKIDKLSSLLDQVLEERRANETAIEEARERTNELRRKGSEIAAEEGRLRKEIAELHTALKGLMRQSLRRK